MPKRAAPIQWKQAPIAADLTLLIAQDLFAGTVRVGDDLAADQARLGGGQGPRRADECGCVPLSLSMRAAKIVS